MDLKLIEKLLKDREFEQVIAMLCHANEANASNSKAIYIRGNAHQEIGNIDAAEKDWESALAMDKNNLAALKKMAELRYQKKEYLSAGELYGRLVKENADDKDSWLQLSKCLLMNKSAKKGFEALNKYIKISQPKEEAIDKACELLWTSGYNKELIALSRKASINFNTSTKFPIYEAKAWIKLSKYEKAKNCLSKNDSGNSTIEGLLYLAICYFRLKDIIKSKKCISTILDKDPENTRANILLGQIHYSCGDINKALEAWEHALSGKSGAQHPEALFWISKYYSENTDNAQKVASTIQKEITITNGMREESHYILITSLLTMSKQTEARKAFIKAKEHFPNSIQIESLKTYLREEKS